MKHKHTYVLQDTETGLEMLCACGVSIRAILKDITPVPLHDYESVAESFDNYNYADGRGTE